MGNLFAELKRRNVVRVAVAYLVVGWIVLQIIDVIVDPLQLPPWTATLVIVLLGLGFPVALLFSWAFELTPQGLKTTEEVDRNSSITPSTGRKLDRLIIVGLVAAVALLLWDRVFQETVTRLVFPPTKRMLWTLLALVQKLGEKICRAGRWVSLWSGTGRSLRIGPDFAGAGGGSGGSPPAGSPRTGASRALFLRCSRQRE